MDERSVTVPCGVILTCRSRDGVGHVSISVVGFKAKKVEGLLAAREQGSGDVALSVANISWLTSFLRGAQREGKYRTASSYVQAWCNKALADGRKLTWSEKRVMKKAKQP